MRGDHLLPATAVATYVLMLLGIYTAAVGAGLTCGARWPLCDGAVFGLFPANWASFVEWFHRLVAMVTGLMILGSWAIAWWTSTDRRTRWALTVAVVLTPVQVWLGAETVLSYEVVVLTAHFLTALLIFAAVVAGAWWWGDRPPTRRRRVRLFGAVALALVPFVALTPQLLFVHTGPIQVMYYGIGLAIVGGLVIAGLDAFAAGATATVVITGTALGIVALRLTAGRLVRTSFVHAVDWLAAAVLLVVGVLAIVAATGRLDRLLD